MVNLLLFPTAGKCGALLIQCTLGFPVTSPNFKSKKLLLLPSFYFYEVLEQLKTFHLERVLRFVSIACNFLRDTTFSWWPREVSYRDSPCIWESANLMFMGSSRHEFTLSQLKSRTDVAVGFLPLC